MKNRPMLPASFPLAVAVALVTSVLVTVGVLVDAVSSAQAFL